MTDATSSTTAWSLGFMLPAEDRHWAISRVRDLTAEEAARIQEDKRLALAVGSLRGLQSLINAVGRWEETVGKVRGRLAAGETVPQSLLTASALDLAAITHAADGCEQGIKATADDLQASAAVSGVAPSAQAPYLEAVETARRFLKTRPSVLAYEAIAPDVRAGRIGLSLDPSPANGDGSGTYGDARPADNSDTTTGGDTTATNDDGASIRVEGVTAFDAIGLGRMLLSEVGRFIGLALAAMTDAISEQIGELEALYGEFPPGVAPMLIGVNDRDDLKHTVDLPVREATALHEFNQRLSAMPPEELPAALFDVVGASTRRQISVGSVIVSSASSQSQANTKVDELPRIDFHLDPDLLGSEIVDFWSPVTYDMAHGKQHHRLFTGAVQRTSGSDPLEVNCEGGVELTEHNRGSLAAAGVGGPELVTTIMRQIGLPQATIVLSSDEKSPRPRESFDVFAPIRGISVAEPLTIGRTRIVPVTDGQAPLDRLDLEGERQQALAAEYLDATAYAVATVEADSLDTAEEEGYSAIETTMAWLVARQRYGLLRLPDGTAQSFSRVEAMQSVRYSPIVLVRGATTGRQWLRWIHHTGQPALRELDDSSGLLHPPLPVDLHPADERALRALMRAANEAGAEQQLQAFSEAVEHYVAGVDVPELFSKQQRKELRKLARDWFTQAQKETFERAIGNLNNPTFGSRLKLRMHNDGVPLRDEEYGLLQVLRNARNDVVHGRAIREPPTREQILRGISIISRALLYGVNARETDGDPADGFADRDADECAGAETDAITAPDPSELDDAASATRRRRCHEHTRPADV